MSLITAHRILIAAAIFLFTIYGIVEIRNYAQSGESFALVRAAISFAVVVGWALYLRTVKKR